MRCYNPIQVGWIKGQSKPVFLKGKNRLEQCSRQDIIDSNTKYGLLPCGKCDACKLNKAADWANRVEKELEQYKNNWFITLTYNEKTIPLIKTKDGIKTNLVKKDLQDFWKRLRKKYSDQKIKYLASGEYGDHTKRAHYHAIVMNLNIKDLKQNTTTKQNNLGQQYYESETINKLWNKGNVIIAKATRETANYVARYTIKKQGTKTEYKEQQNPFITMSNGIGKTWYEKNKNWIFATDYIIVNKGKMKTKPPRYYEKLATKDYGEDYMKEIKKERNIKADIALKNKLRQTNSTYTKIMLDEAKNTANIKKILNSKGKI